MRRAVIVIGCSYGDEGKGLAASWSARRLGGKCLNILINGGAQRGHTVDLPDGQRHVFHHFGSAALQGAVSCADEDFIVNPLLYAQERRELADGFGISPVLTVSDRCRVSLPWDMMLGQIIEENRGHARHGSCGCGIQETRLRFLHTDWALRFGQMAELGEDGFTAYCRRVIGEYLPERLRGLGMSAGKEWLPILRDRGIIRHAWQDWLTVRDTVSRYARWEEEAASFSTLIFEAGQGLALDAENTADFPYLTPSRTTSQVSARRIAVLPGRTETELLYVTRSYLTRHGAGPFPTECAMERINPAIVDRTNTPNPHQQSIRYGFFDGPAVLDRVNRDRGETMRILPDAKAAVMVTHLNETGGKLAGDTALEDFTTAFDRAYLSDCPWDARPAAPDRVRRGA
ncbi:MAG: adenylosuccinate synthetase [Clostridia bacterium]|nr:adenylosuccinate synthetase [Clostridia bacterium]